MSHEQRLSLTQTNTHTHTSGATVIVVEHVFGTRHFEKNLRETIQVQVTSVTESLFHARFALLHCSSCASELPTADYETRICLCAFLHRFPLPLGTNYKTNTSN